MEIFLKLGKQVSEIVIERHRTSYLAYVDADSMEDNTLKKIGEALISDKDKFYDYIRFLTDEEGFDWAESEVNSYDFVEEIVSYSLDECDEYCWNGEWEAYMKTVYLSEINSSEDVLNVISEVSLNNPRMIMLDKKDYSYITLVEIKRDSIYELCIPEDLDINKYSGLYDVDRYESVLTVLSDRIYGTIKDYQKSLQLSV